MEMSHIHTVFYVAINGPFNQKSHIKHVESILIYYLIYFIHSLCSATTTTKIKKTLLISIYFIEEKFGNRKRLHPHMTFYCFCIRFILRHHS